MADGICGEIKAVAQGMSLLSERFEPFAKLERVETPDGLGGYTVKWSEGEQFEAAAVLDSSTAAKIAAAMGVKDIYTITTRKAVTLRFHSVIKRLSDGKTFRITSNGDDKCTPPSARLDMRQVSAELWEIPESEVEKND